MAAAFALSIFIGAFLLFLVQPLIALFILPWFGGGPGVWTTCLLFFQVTLLAGYGYAHFSARRLRPRWQIALHLALTLVAILLLPIRPSDSLKPGGATAPEGLILILLLKCIGLPYFVLSATGPLLQHWFALANPQRSAYRLYALSNVGSLLALLSYPFLLEPNLARGAQASAWGWGLLGYALVCTWAAAAVWNRSSPEHTPVQMGLSDAVPAPGVVDQLLWILLPACATTLLLAITNKLCLDVAVVPFLWIIPLSVYLLTFIIAFDRSAWYSRFAFTFLFIVAAVALTYALYRASDWSLWIQVSVFGGGLFVCGMVCHGELYQLRPGAPWLTRYYLLIATGGALGGCFAALLAPLWFHDYIELHWGLFACGALLLAIHMRGVRPTITGKVKSNSWENWWLSLLLPVLGIAGLDYGITHTQGFQKVLTRELVLVVRIFLWGLALLSIASWASRQTAERRRYSRITTLAWLTLGLVSLGLVLYELARHTDAALVGRWRNFYGVLSVLDYRLDDPDNHYRVLRHGRITHGLQFLNPDFEAWPTTYYGESSGVGLAIDSLPKSPRRLGLVGLGTGTLAAYGRTNDYLRIYEINPEVIRLARTRFSYLSNCPARVDLVLGDARLSLEREPAQNFDLLALDAFSSDAIPVHLLTRESFRLYLTHLKPSGLLAVHISNHYLNLQPVVATLARDAQLHAVLIDTDTPADEWWNYGSTWMILARDPAALQSLQKSASPPKAEVRDSPIWTDDFTSLYRLLKKPK